MVVFLALEIFSLGLYILAGLKRSDLRSNEAAMKYFLLGAFASAFFVYGVAFVYGATGSTQFDAIAAAQASGAADLNFLYAGIALLIAGFGFKVSLVPFHMWTPDVYQGAPTPVTAFMSVGTKAARLCRLLPRLRDRRCPTQQPVWGWALAILAVLDDDAGQPGRAAPDQPQAPARLFEHRPRRLHPGRPGARPRRPRIDGALFYLISYAFMNMGAFAVVILLETAGRDGRPLQPAGRAVAGRTRNWRW